MTNNYIYTSCLDYSNSIKNVLSELYNFEISLQDSKTVHQNVINKSDVYFSILFTGTIYGEFIIGLKKQTALDILNISYNKTDIDSVYAINKEFIIDNFKEIINIAAGTALKSIKERTPDVTITPPRALEGELHLPTLKLNKLSLSYDKGIIDCYIYIDEMRLDIANKLSESDANLKNEQSKQEELKRLNKAKTEFLANMSHELRTPLNGMIGMLDIIKTTRLNSLQKEQLDIVCKSGDFLLSIINDILEFSKIESGKLSIELRPYDLRECIESVAETLAPEVFKKNLEFKVFIDPLIHGKFHIDTTRIKQVLINLVGNAIKFTPTGTIEIRADAHKINSEDLKLSLSVSDTGIGIPKSKITNIFNSFSQVDVSDNRKYGGSGLGLTISKSIIEALGGKLTVASEEAKGTTFTAAFDIKKVPITLIQNESKIENLDLILLTKNSEYEDLVRSILNLKVNTLKIATQNTLSISPSNRASFIAIDYKFWKKEEDESKIKLIHSLEQVDTLPLIVVTPIELQELEKDEIKSKLPKKYTVLKLPILSKYIFEKLSLVKVDTTKSPEKAKPTLNSSKKTILIVEDNPINQMVTKMMVEKLGYSTQIVQNGQEAVDAYRHTKFDLILMDCQMPIKNGYEATQEIRELEKQTSCKTPIIAMTANAFRETKEQCFESGMDNFITKPTKIEALKDMIEKIFDTNS